MGRRRNTRVFTFDLSSSHAREAFEDALDNDEFDVEDALTASRNPTANSTVLKNRNKRAQQSPGFLQADASSTPGSSRQQPAVFTDAETVHLIDLVSIFGEAHDKELIQDVFTSCHCSFEAALQVLSDMTTTLEVARAAAQADADEGVATPLNPFLPTPGVAWWDLLHESLKESVFGYLSARDLARVAWTCKDFAWRVRNGRMNARSLVIPAGVTLNSVLGMVAGHTNARAISLVRWGAAHLRDADFRALITAVAQGSCSSRRNVRVEALSLRGWSSATDSNMLTCLDAMRHLRELDLSDCSSLTDAALGPLSRYQHEPDTRPGLELDSDDDDEDEQQQLQEQEALVATTPPAKLPATSWAVAAAATPATPPVPAAIVQESCVPSPPSLELAGLSLGGGEGNSGSAMVGQAAGISPPAIAASVGGLGLLAGGLQGQGAAVADKGRGSGTGSWGRPPLGSLESKVPVQGGGVRRATADEDELLSEAGSQVAGESDDEYCGVMLDEELERKAARRASAATPPPTSTARSIPGPGSAIHRSGSYSSTSGTPAHQGGLYGTSPTAVASPLLGTSPPTFASRSPSLSGSLGKGGSIGSLGKTMFSKFTGSASGSGLRVGTPPHADLKGSYATSSSSTSRGLEVLCLAGCSRISAEGVKALLSAPVAKQCLHALDVSRCMRLTRAALVLPPQASLRVLKAAECQNFHEISMHLPLNSPLQELWLNNCRHLTKLSVVAPRLSLLHVGGCKSLISLQLKCPRLTQLLSNLCIKLSDIQAEDITAPVLEELNMFGCRQISSPAVAALLQGSPKLQLLNLNGCLMLTELHLPEHLEVRAIDLTGCKQVAGVVVASPQLTTLSARACHRLTSMQLRSACLTTLDLTNCSSLTALEFPALSQTTNALSGHHDIERVLAARPRVHPATQDVIASAAVRTQLALAALGVLPVHVRAPGCEGVPALASLAFKVLRHVITSTQPKPPAK